MRSSEYALSLQPWAVYCLTHQQRLVQRFSSESDAAGFLEIVQRKVPHNHYAILYNPTTAPESLPLNDY